MNLIHQLIYVSLLMMFHMVFNNLHDFGVLAFITLCKAPGSSTTPLYSSPPTIVIFILV
jgi:hypothetical protein